MNMIMKFFTYMMNMLTKLISKFMKKKNNKKNNDSFKDVNPYMSYLINRPYAEYVDFEEI